MGVKYAYAQRIKPQLTSGDEPGTLHRSDRWRDPLRLALRYLRPKPRDAYRLRGASGRLCALPPVPATAPHRGCAADLCQHIDDLRLPADDGIDSPRRSYHA